MSVSSPLVTATHRSWVFATVTHWSLIPGIVNVINAAETHQLHLPCILHTAQSYIKKWVRSDTRSRNCLVFRLHFLKTITIIIDVKNEGVGWDVCVWVGGGEGEGVCCAQ